MALCASKQSQALALRVGEPCETEPYRPAETYPAPQDAWGLVLVCEPS